MELQILKWVFIALFSLSIIANIYMIDKPRKPLSRGDAILNVAINVLLIILLL